MGAATGILGFAGDSNLPRAVLTGAGGFATAVLLVLAFVGYVSNVQQSDGGDDG